MVCMSRNKSRFFYALYVSKEQGTDECGNPTGGVDITYGDPQEYRANVSAAKGETQTRQFGESENYDKATVMGGTHFALVTQSERPVFSHPGHTVHPED